MYASARSHVKEVGGQLRCGHAVNSISKISFWLVCQGFVTGSFHPTLSKLPGCKDDIYIVWHLLYHKCLIIKNKSIVTSGFISSVEKQYVMADIFSSQHKL